MSTGLWMTSSKGFAHVPDYPLDTPMWGVVDLYGRCDQVKAEICTGEFGDR